MLRPLRLFDDASDAVIAFPPQGGPVPGRADERIRADDDGWWLEEPNERIPLRGDRSVTFAPGQVRHLLPGAPGQAWPVRGIVCVEALRARDLLVVRARRPEVFRLSWSPVVGPVAGLVESRLDGEPVWLHRTVVGPTWGQVQARSAEQGASVPAELTAVVERVLAEQGYLLPLGPDRVRIGFNGAIRAEPGEDADIVGRPLIPKRYLRVSAMPLGAFVSSLFADEREALEDAVANARLATL